MIKRIYISTLLLFCAIFTNAQVIPNSGFEMWSTDGSYEIADFWTNSNVYTWQLTNTTGVYSAIDHVEGQLAAMLITTDLGFAGQPYPGWIVNGLPKLDLMTGVVDFFTAGTEFSEKPNILSGYYIYENNYVSTDSACVIIYFKKFNNITNQADTIAYGYKKLGPTVGYTNFEVGINDIVAGVLPDSMIIAFTTTDIEQPVSGASLWIDDLNFQNTNSLEGEAMSVEFSTYPNPASDKIYIDYNGQGEQLNVNIYNFVGKLVKLSRISRSVKRYEIDVSDLPVGAYLVRMESRSGISETEKLIIKRS